MSPGSVFMDVRADVVTETTADAGANVEAELLKRYAAGEERVEPELCCPTVGYDAHSLRALPAAPQRRARGRQRQRIHGNTHCWASACWRPLS